METRIEHLTDKTAKYYVLDGYHLQSYQKEDNPPQITYKLCHENGNKLKIIGDAIDAKIYIYFNGKFNKEIDIK